MERNFSVDDIVGTLWKLDTNSSNNNTTSSSNPTGDLIQGSNFSLEIASAQDLGGLADEAFKRITRVDSDWAFQDYFKFHESTKADGSDTPERAMRRNESMWAFQDFLKNYVLNDSSKADGKSHQSGKKGAGEYILDLNVSPSDAPAHMHDCGGNSSLGADDGVAHDVKQDHGDGTERHNTKNSQIHSNVEGSNPNISNSMHTEVSVGDCNHQQGHSHTSRARPLDAALFDSNLTEASDIENDLTSMEPFGIQHHISVSPGDDAPHTKQFREQQVSGALNPLFTGLQTVTSNVGHANPQEYEMMLKRQLDLACAAVASKRACYRLNKGAPQAVLMEVFRQLQKSTLCLERPLNMVIDWCLGH